MGAREEQPTTGNLYHRLRTVMAVINFFRPQPGIAGPRLQGGPRPLKVLGYRVDHFLLWHNGRHNERILDL